MLIAHVGTLAWALALMPMWVLSVSWVMLGLVIFGIALIASRPGYGGGGGGEI